MSTGMQSAAEHVAHAEKLLADAERKSDLDLVVIAQGHLDVARTLTKMEEVRNAQQALLNAKGQAAGMLDALTRVLPGGDGP